MVNRKKIMVVGGYGFLGKHIVEELQNKKYDPVILSRRNGYDIMDFPKFASKLKDEQPFALINCAAHVGSVHYAIKYAGEMVRDNMQIILNIYDAVKISSPETKIINPISNCSYPGEANTHYEPDWQKGEVHDSVLAYASTRRMIYAFAECYRKQYGIKSVNWLIANSYGPGDYSDPNKVHALNGILIRLIKAQKNKDQTFEIWGTGKPIREWSYIRDVARIMVKSLDIKEQIYPLNFAQNKAYSIKEIAEIGAKILDYKVSLTFNTKFPDGAMFKILDDRQFRSKYPQWRFTPLKTGIQNTISYYQKLL